MPGFTELISPLTDLAPGLVQWTEQCQAAFVQVKRRLWWRRGPCLSCRGGGGAANSRGSGSGVGGTGVHDKTNEVSLLYIVKLETTVLGTERTLPM